MNLTTKSLILTLALIIAIIVCFVLLDAATAGAVTGTLIVIWTQATKSNPIPPENP